MFPVEKQNAEFYEVLALGEMLHEYDGNKVAQKTIKDGGGKREFMNKIIEGARCAPLHRWADKVLGIDSGSDDCAGYSLTRAVKAAVQSSVQRNNSPWEKAGLEKSMSDLAATSTGQAPNGFYVPYGILARDFNVSTATQAGNLIGAQVSGERVADPLRGTSALGRMGVTFLTGLKTTLGLPLFTSSSSAAWKSEIAAAGEVLEATGLAVLTPKRCPVTMVFSRQALLQSEPALDQTISRHLTAAIMQQLEDAALNGDGTNDKPVGLRYTSGIANIVGGADGAQIDFTHLADMENGPSSSSADETQFSGFLVNSSTRRWLRTAPRGTNLPYIWEGGERALLGHHSAVANTLPNNLTKGASGAVCSALTFSADWSQLVIGLYGGGVDLTVDTVTLADVGKVRVTAAVLAGVGTNLPAAFAKMDDGKTA